MSEDSGGRETLRGMRGQHIRMLCLELALVVLGNSFAAAADGSPLAARGQGTGAPNELSVALSPSDGESERADAPPLRSAVPPLKFTAAEAPLAPRVPAVGRSSPASSYSDSEPPPTRRMGSPPPLLRLATPEEPLASGGAPSTTAPQEQHWSSFLPFFAEEVRRMGYELPLPIGVGAIYNYLSRGIEVTDVRVGVNGAAPDSVSQFANFNARGTVSGALVKADVWLFPFLDVYLLLGYIYNTTDVNVQVTVPRPGPLPGNR